MADARPALPLMTPRLRLRDACDADFDAVHRYASDPEVTRFMAWGPNDAQATREFLAHARAAAAAQPRREFALLVEEGASGRVIGGCGLHPTGLEREWELGYVFAREAWGHGFATETARALCELGFGALRAHRLRAGVFPGNAASAHVLEKLGFRREGHLRQTRFLRGAWHDEWVYALLEDDWQAAP